MKKALLLIVAAAALALSAPAAFAKGGDGSGDDKGGNNPAQTSGKDDPAGHDAGDDKGDPGHGADDPANHDANDDKSKANGPSSSKGKKANARTKVKNGTCTIRSTSKLKANLPKNGRVQVEFEVESHVSGQVWNVLLTDNGNSFSSRKATTKAPGGSFEIRASAKNRAGTDAIWASATNPASGETCKASVSV
jgi:hypothetical protein